MTIKQFFKNENKTKTLNYLKNNNINYTIQNNTIVSFQFDELYCEYTKVIHQDENLKTPIILIHNF